MKIRNKKKKAANFVEEVFLILSRYSYKIRYKGMEKNIISQKKYF